jgi:hypothetical protein
VGLDRAPRRSWASTRTTVASSWRGGGHGRLTKFQPCLPERLVAELLADALTDEVGARQVVAECG